MMERWNDGIIDYWNDGIMGFGPFINYLNNLILSVNLHLLFSLYLNKTFLLWMKEGILIGVI